MRRLSRTLKGVTVSMATLAIGAFAGNARVFAGPQATGTVSGPSNLPAAVPLRLQKTSQLDFPAPNASRNGAKCDAGGSVFVQFGNYDFGRQQFQLDSAISEVSPDSKRVVAHRIPAPSASDYPNPRLMSFSVLPSGEVYALISTRRTASDGEPKPAEYEHYVEQLKEDITTDSMTRIQAPPGAARWSADLLGAFPKGNFLIAGQKSEEAGRPGAGSWRPFTAIYDSSGRFLIELTLPDDVANNSSEDTGSADTNAAAAAGTAPARGSSDHAAAPVPSTQPPKPSESLGVSIRSGGIVSGPDGNLWILRESKPLRLYAVDAAGQVVRHFQFSSPVPGLTPAQFGFAGPEQIFFDFVRFPHADAASGPYAGPSEIIGVFDVVSEQFDALYTLPSTENGAGFFGCGDGQGGFTYLGHTPDNHLAVFDFRQ